MMRLLTAAVAGLIVGGLATAAILSRGRPVAGHVAQIYVGDRPMLRVVG